MPCFGKRILLAVTILAVFFIGARSAAAAEPPAPTLISARLVTVTAETKPLITGLTKASTTVSFFIDGLFDGQTGILAHLSGTANFAYRPATALSLGSHEIRALAVNENGGGSILSAPVYFKIELPFPAPTMFKPVVNMNTTSARPFMVGLAKNDSLIKVYLDDKLDGEFLVANHKSGTANFAYRPNQPLKRGEHAIYTIAVDGRGKTSIHSNPVVFTVRIAAITATAGEEKAPVEPAPKNDGELNRSKSAAGQVSAGDNQPEENKNQASGMINESRLGQGRLKTGSALFILFLVGVIAWLVWVNRELAKEARQQAESQTDEKKQDKLL